MIFHATSSTVRDGGRAAVAAGTSDRAMRPAFSSGEYGAERTWASPASRNRRSAPAKEGRVM